MVPWLAKGQLHVRAVWVRCAKVDEGGRTQWIAVGSTRGYDALTPMSRIVRPAFLPADIQGAVYEAYRGTGDGTNIPREDLPDSEFLLLE